MKKIIATGLGLMVGGSAMIASANVEFSGDARARYYYQDNYSQGQSGDHWNSRVRLNVKATTEGGAFAKTRIIMQDNGWGTESNLSDTSGSDISVDRAYIGVPLGDFVVTAGRQQLELTPGFFADVDLDNLRVTYERNDTKVTAFYSVLASTTYDYGNGSEYDDSEDRLYGAALQQSYAGWDFFVGAVYQDADLKLIEDRESGFMANVGASGQLGPVALAGEFGFQEDGVVATDELYTRGGVEATGKDGFGAYVSAGMDFDALNVTFLGGFTQEGFTFDEQVGFVMIGGDNQMTPDNTYVIGHYNGTAADTIFAGLKTNYTMSEDLDLGFNLAYAKMENSNNSTTLDEFNGNLWEVSATAGYAINDGTMLYVNAGYLDVEWEDDPVIGAGVSLELAF